MDKNPSLHFSILLTAVFILLLGTIRLAESVSGVSLSGMGVYPQSVSGAMGIIVAPLIHGSWAHLISNTLPVMLLGSMLIYGYPKSRWWVILCVWIGSGVGVWLFARTSYHIGASGLAHGLFFFLFVAGILRRDKRSSALLMVAFFMYGTMLWTIFPQEPGISFEYHFFGAISGGICALLFRHRDPLPERRVYSWELEDANEFEEDDPVIGDEWKAVNAPPAQHHIDNAHEEVNKRLH